MTELALVGTLEGLCIVKTALEEAKVDGEMMHYVGKPKDLR